MKSKYSLLLFIGICLFQWIVFSGWIIDFEKIIKEGKYLKIRYLNPNNLYAANTNRNYLWITPDPNTIEFTDSGKYVLNQTVYIKYDCDQYNTCNSYRILTGEFKNDPYLIRATVQSVFPSVKSDNQKIYIANLSYPYTQFYFNSAVSAEKLDLYNRSIADSSNRIYIGVYSLNGKAIADALWVENVKIE
jgi:hypothetical protein